MLKRKLTVQKSFRIDYLLSNDLEYLSNVLDRPQNDLVNIAIEEFILDNKQWFIGEILINQCSEFFEDDRDVEIKIDNMQLILQVYAENSVRIVYCISNKFGDPKIQEEMEVEYETKEEVKKVLKELAQLIDSDGITINKLIRERLNYK